LAGLRILVCVKRVPAPGARLALTADRLAVDTRSLGFTISPHEECALEEALRLYEQHGGEATVLTLGPPEAEEQLRYALSLGVASAVHVTHDELAGGRDWDPQATAGALAGAVRELEAAGGSFDLILFGNESADAGGFQVGVRVARALGRPIVNGIKQVTIEGGTVIAQRESDEGFEIYRLDLPAVLGVKEGLNLPRYPTVPGRLRSRKAGVQVIQATLAPGGLVSCRYETAPEVAVQTEVLGRGPDAAPAVVDLIERLGLL
jgi:electron transfer flavoprotein beta subunit